MYGGTVDRVNVTELRQNLASWLDRVKNGEELAITERGTVIARVVPAADRKAAARARLEALRGTIFLGDVTTPVAPDDWDAAR